MTTIFLQADIDAEVQRQGLIDIILQGGVLGIVIMATLFLLSIIAVYIFLERYFTIKRAGQIDESFMNNVKTNVAAGNISAARALCQTTDSPVARLVDKGVQRIGKPLADIESSIENVGNLEVFKLEKGLSTLASIAGAAPMIGFFGTVTGMIMAFYKMSTAENISPEVLADGIYQALLTTAFGLFVGILAFIGYNILVTNVSKVMFKMEHSTVEFMDLLQEPAG